MNFVKSAQAVSFVFPTHLITGAVSNADSTPTGTLYVNGTANGATVTITNIATGEYKADFTTPSGMEDYTPLQLMVTATMGGVQAKGVVWTATKLQIQVPSVVGRGTDSEAEGVNLTAKVGATGTPVSCTCEDSAGDPIDLTDWGDKVLVIERPGSRTDVQVIEQASLTISGDDNETFAFQPSSTVLANPADFLWSLREASSGYVIIDGRLSVSYSPLEDA